MTLLSIFLATSIAFPKPGMTLPPIEQCYVIGAADGATNVFVNGVSVPVSRTGAWTAMIDVHAGVNTVRVDSVVRVFRVDPPQTAQPRAPKPYAKLTYAGDTPRPHPCGKARSATTIVLDPGHGGSTDTGALSPHGWCEKDANLLLAEDVRNALSQLGYRVILTRRDDRALALYDRPKYAHAEEADAFVSIHHNAPPANRDPGSIRYECVYSWNALGEALASAIARRMRSVRANRLPNNGSLHANYAVTRNPEIPSCLIEADFITHPEGEAAAWDASVRRPLAEAIAAGIDDWQRGQSDAVSK